MIEVATAGAGAGAEGTFPLKSAHYSVSSTVMLTLNRHEGGTGPLGNVDMSGSLTRQVGPRRSPRRKKHAKSTTPADISGTLAGSLKTSKPRSGTSFRYARKAHFQEIYFGKMHDVVDQLRSLDDLEASHNAKRLQQELVAGWER